MSLQRKNYWSLDIAKFFCALTIISSHFASEHGSFPTLIDYGFSIYIIGVPFFFCCSGFLFFKKLNSMNTKEEKKAYFIQYEKRIWVMYGLWSAVYFFTSVLPDWIVDGELGVKTFLRFIHQSLVYSTYSTIWFLPALAIGIAIVYFLLQKLSVKKMCVLAIALYIIGSLGYTYSFVVNATPLKPALDLYLEILLTSRNALFNGAPFIFLGYFISTKEFVPSTKGFFKYAIPAGISFVLMIAEAFILKLKFNVTGMDISIFVAVFTVFFMLTLMHIDLKENKLWLWCRKLSLLIFVSQRLFLSVLPQWLPSVTDKLYTNSYLGLVLVIAMTIAFSVVFILLSDKIKFLKKMI